MKFLVVSSGALGCLWASVLAKEEKNRVVLIHHRKTFVDAIKRQNGILLRIDKSKSNELVNLQAFTSIQDGVDYLNGDVDCILFLVKVFTTGKVLKELKKETLDLLIKQKTLLCTLQNGLTNVEKLLMYFSKTEILFGTTVTHAIVIKDGLIEGNPNRPTSLWSASNTLSQIQKRTVKVFTECGFPSVLTKDAELMLWKKMAVNCAINSVTALTLLKIGACVNECDNVGKELMSEIASEVARVAQTEGVSLSEKEAIDSLIFVVQKAGNHISSMCNDILNHRQTEVENLNGFVYRVAKKKRVSVPMIKTTYMLVKILQDTYSKKLTEIKNTR